MSWSPSRAACDVIAERARQMAVEGWSDDHDDGHSGGELAIAAGNYVVAAFICARLRAGRFDAGPPLDVLVSLDWPWARAWWKPGTARRMLVKAAALIIAEIERLDRRDAAHGK